MVRCIVNYATPLLLWKIIFFLFVGRQFEIISILDTHQQWAYLIAPLLQYECIYVEFWWEAKRHDMRFHSLHENTWFYFIIPFHEPGIDILMTPFSVNFPWHDFIIFHNWRKRLKFKNVITNYCHNIFVNEQKLIIIHNIHVYKAHGRSWSHSCMQDRMYALYIQISQTFSEVHFEREELKTFKNLIQRVLQ